MYAVLAFDTEDVYFPPSYRIDDVPGWLAEIMTESDVRGTFFTMGEKARSLKERGRTDVLTRMARHDIASHQQGNCRPLLPQVVETCGWDDGVEAVRAYEESVTRELLEAFGAEPTGLSRHNCYFAPQHVAHAAERGLPYMYLVTHIKEYEQPLWYAGTVCFPCGPCMTGSFDTVYSNDELFAERLKKVDADIATAVDKGYEFMTVFGCHPCRVLSHGWQEHYVLASGRTRPPAELGWLYAVKSPAEEERAKANFRKLCEYLRDHPDLDVVGIGEAGKLFSTQPARIPRAVLATYAGDVEEAAAPVFQATYSPAELVCALADSILHHETGGDVPAAVDRRDVLGPVSRPVLAIEKDAVTHTELVAMCREMQAHVEKFGRLPANVAIGDEHVGIGQLLVLAARAYLALVRYEKTDTLRNKVVPRYPDAAFEIDAWIRHCIGEHWALPLDFDHSKLAELARLQTWTMKPAWLKPPQGPDVEAARNLAPEF